MSYIEENVATLRDGSTYKIYVPQNKKSYFGLIVGSLISYMAAVLTMYGTLEFSRPDLIKLASDNIPASVALFVGVGIGLVSFALSMGSLGRATFEKAASLGLKTTPNEGDVFKEDFFSYGTCSSNTDFEGFISNILKEGLK